MSYALPRNEASLVGNYGALSRAPQQFPPSSGSSVVFSVNQAAPLTGSRILAVNQAAPLIGSRNFAVNQAAPVTYGAPFYGSSIATAPMSYVAPPPGRSGRTPTRGGTHVAAPQRVTYDAPAARFTTSVSAPQAVMARAAPALDRRVSEGRPISREELFQTGHLVEAPDVPPDRKHEQWGGSYRAPAPAPLKIYQPPVESYQRHSRLSEARPLFRKSGSVDCIDHHRGDGLITRPEVVLPEETAAEGPRISPALIQTRRDSGPCRGAFPRRSRSFDGY